MEYYMDTGFSLMGHNFIFPYAICLLSVKVLYAILKWVLFYIAVCAKEYRWILIFELCPHV